MVPHIEDIITIALLYRYQYANTEMISYDAIKEYEETINKNLDEMKITGEYGNFRFSPFSIFRDYKIYGNCFDENQKLFAVINSYEKLNEARRLVNYLPMELLIAATKDNALAKIGLKREEENVVQLVKK